MVCNLNTFLKVISDVRVVKLHMKLELSESTHSLSYHNWLELRYL